jgi:hypothetical protein
VNDQVERDPGFVNKAVVRVHARLKFAFVAFSPEAKTLARHYITYSEAAAIPWEYRIFDNVNSATTWLEGQKEPESSLSKQPF